VCFDGCPAGRFTLTNSKDCLDCPAGRYQDAQNQPTCKLCGSAAFYCPAGSPRPTRVLRGYVSGPATAPAVARSAVEQCPAEGMECIDGIAHIVDGYWLPPWITAITARTRIYKCMRASSCSSAYGLSVTCGTGLRGLLCGVCDEGYGKAAGGCVTCPPVGWTGLLSLGLGALAVWVALAFTRKTLPANEWQARPSSWLDWLRRKAGELFSCVISLGATTLGSTDTAKEATGVLGALRDGDAGVTRRKATSLAITRILVK
jgi:hypothetical protein